MAASGTAADCLSSGPAQGDGLASRKELLAATKVASTVSITASTPEHLRKVCRINTPKARTHGVYLAESPLMELGHLVDRARNEFIEMPGLQLTVSQAARLWGLDHAASRHVIDALVAGSFLRWTVRGTVIRGDRTGA